MKCSDKGKAFIKSWEKCSLRSYNDGFGFWTCGWGHHDNSINVATVWTQAYADEVFEQDIASIEANVNAWVTVVVNQNQFDALCAFEFNCGAGALKYHDLLRYLNAGNYAAAANEFPKWVYSGGKFSEGLLKRSTAEQKLFLGEETA